ncbi:SMP-30/gluconolactonase/LRE family protein [Methylobacterium sp. Leaf118]|uniref:SMP-30/gluconolactonase/LRE family protein n=1 Tax=Methylobacterium sp. Leaf118 TaxID=2876562 RepID=UPI001E4061E9|nr:SMP-30/gluconolactonase/LRE family protein [Methylobacterium sp. Leaf118]
MTDSARSSRGLTRRPLLGLALLAPVAAQAGEGLASVLAPGARVETLYGEGAWCEGPVWVPALNSLVFSDVRRNRMLRLPEGGRPEVFRAPSANANGNTLDREGRLVTCEHRTGQVVRREGDGRLTVLAERFEGRRLNSPNDVVVARDGAVWFTDPTFGIVSAEEGEPRPSEQAGSFVYRCDPDGGLAIVTRAFRQPNGLAFSPDERRLYVSEAGAALDATVPREIRAFDVADGRLTGERVFARIESGVPDGIRVDTEGRVYCGAGEGVRIWNPDGAFLGLIPTEGPCANIAFGGPDGRRLYICAGPRVLAVETRMRGAGLHG